jgi:hypothetical protein
MGFKMKGSPMHRNFGVGASPLEQNTKEEHANQGTTVYEGRDNKKGQSQADVIKMREKKISDYNKAVEPYKNEEGDMDLTEKQYEKYKINLDNLHNANKFSRDSIDNKNEIMNADFNKKNEEIKKKNEEIKKKNADSKKRADDSGLFEMQGSPAKHTEDPHTPHKKNTSFKGNIMTNTETGDTYDLKTGETTKNKKGRQKQQRKERARE